MIHVIKHDMDPNSNINYSRKIGPLYPSHLPKILMNKNGSITGILASFIFFYVGDFNA